MIDVGSALNASLGMGMPKRGGVSLITQSGAYAMAAFSRSLQGDLGIRRVVAPGNKADVDEVDAVRWLARDPQTRVIAMLLESIGDGAGLVREIRAADKPVVILKNGRGQAGQRAAASHTAALANDSRVAAAALRQAGARLVTDGLALLDSAVGLDLQPAPSGPRAAIVTNSGGTGVELTDLLEGEGLEVPRLGETLRTAFRELLPRAGSAENPIDLTTDWVRFPELYGETLRALLRSDEFDVVILVLLQRSALSEDVANRVLKEVERSARCRMHDAGARVLGGAGRSRTHPRPIDLRRHSLSPVAAPDGARCGRNVCSNGEGDRARKVASLGTQTRNLRSRRLDRHRFAFFRTVLRRTFRWHLFRWRTAHRRPLALGKRSDFRSCLKRSVRNSCTGVGRAR